MDPSPAWTLAQRLLFRAFASYFLMFAVISEGGVADSVVPWFGAAVLRIAGPIDSTFNGSGDKLFHYVRFVLTLLIAAAVTAVWSVVDRRRPAYPRLNDLVRILLRYALAAAMLSYGFAKIIPSQFPANEPDRLVQQFGSASPMGLLWAFMGASAPYTIFGGVMEALAGVLLVFRRTALIGSLVCAAVITNVVMLNFCYDVPVKLYSLHLLFFAMVYAAPDLPWLLRAAVLRVPVTPRPLWVPFGKRWLNIGARLIQAGAIALLGYIYGSGAMESYRRWTEPKPKDFGVWKVEEFVRDGVVVPPSLDDADRWRRMNINSYGNATIHAMTGASRYRKVDENTDTALKFSSLPFDKVQDSQVFTRSNPGPGEMILEGTWKEKPVRVRLKHVSVDEFLLNARGFHWINETPPNY